MSGGNAVTPTSTSAQARVMLYQPSLRPRPREGDWMDTSFGRCRVTGRLGQRHADIVEAILYCAERRRDVSDGGVELLVDLARVRKTLSDSRYSFTQIEKLLVELRAATITIETPQFDFPIIGGLIDHVIPSPMTRRDPLTGGARNLWRVRLGVALVMLLEHDLSLYYDPAPIARLIHGISQAVARHVLSHKVEPTGGWYIDTVIVAVSGKGSDMRKARHRLKEDAAGLRAIGLLLDGNRIRKKRAGGV
ncbi:MAG: ABC transporter ATPase [Klebsiella variicola]|nr:ABC transporter ATPase [Klebsiella variicola]